MKSVPKLIRRFVAILLLSCVLLIVLNITLLAAYTANQASNSRPYKTAQQVADTLVSDENGYHLPEETALELQNEGVWAILIDNADMQVIWQTDDLPDGVPISYSASDIASLTRGYINGYPTFTAAAKNGLVVLGYPQKSFWKHMWPSWDYSFIANFPKTIVIVLTVNVALIFIIYAAANSGLLRSVKPIVNGIQALPTKETVYVRERGVLSELAASINKTSEILQSQNRQLSKRDNARANWIAGVSHDIRTPLSMVMGYAGQLESDERLPEDCRRKAAVIVKQSARMRDLINDLNLASKLEYNMQPINPAKQNVVAIVRQVVVDFINMDLDSRHPIEWRTSEELTVCFADVDKDLIRRAVSNLIQNCISHNEQGCHIDVSVAAENGICTITVADDGAGASDEQLEQLNHAPHYMVCDENTMEQRHGLGLLIVKQIVTAHHGDMEISRSASGGFQVQLLLPAII